MFQLKHHLEQLHVSSTHDSLAITSGNLDHGDLEGLGDIGDNDMELDMNGICDGKPETGNHAV